MAFVSSASCHDEGFDLKDATEALRETILPPASCGSCGSTRGKYIKGDDAIIFGRMGCKEATVFPFHCETCSGISGPTTVALPTERGSPARHVVSLHIQKAKYFLPLRKPHQRRDEYVGYSRSLLEAFTNDAATHKSFE